MRLLTDDEISAILGGFVLPALTVVLIVATAWLMVAS